MRIEFQHPNRSGRVETAAFTLLEVLVACAIFFAAIFAILDLTSQSIASARRLQNVDLDISSVAATLSLTNRLEEGNLPSEVTGLFEDSHPGFTCTGEIREISTNGLFQVDFEISGVRGRKVVASTMSILLYRPGSGPSAFGSRRLQ